MFLSHNKCSICFFIKLTYFCRLDAIYFAYRKAIQKSEKAFVMYGTPSSPAPLSVVLAQHHAQVRAAQRLRQQVLDTGTLTLDGDYLDRYCEHLLVREPAYGEVIATARLLAPEQAKKLGGYAVEENFDLIRWLPIRERLVEISHVCIHPDFLQN